MGVELVLLYRLEMEVGPVRILADAPFGTRVIVPITRGRVEGDRIRGQTLELTGDWLTISADGAVGMLDIRGTVETDDGALIYASYKGRTDLSGGVGAAPLYAAPMFETGDERYRWLNLIQAVAKGEIAPDLSRITFEVYEVR